jgi:hypothetical protein
MSGLG